MTQDAKNTNEFNGPRLSTQQQSRVDDLCQTHDLHPSQISFEGNDINPIFDYEAACLLSLKLTDIADISTSIGQIDPMRHLESKASATATLADGRSRTVEDSAEIGEVLGNGMKIETKRDADGIAQNRAVRRVLRSVGVNLWRAHENFKKNGVIASGSTDNDPRAANYREIHVLAEELDLIVEGNRQAYEHFLHECYGKTSSRDLNDLELHQLLVQLRAMASQKRSRDKSAA